jgi:hypothetical protein
VRPSKSASGIEHRSPSLVLLDLGSRTAARERIEKRSDVGLSVPDEPPDAYKWNSGAGHAILLQRASGAAGFFSTSRSLSSGSSMGNLLWRNAPQKVATRRCPK